MTTIRLKNGRIVEFALVDGVLVPSCEGRELTDLEWYELDRILAVSRRAA